MSKKNPIKENFAAMTFLGGIYVTCFAVMGAGIIIYDNFIIDHTEEKCELCKFLGLKHQVTMINNDFNSNYYAKYIEPTEEIIDDFENVEKIINEDGSISYFILEGYQVVDNGVSRKENVLEIEDEKVEVYDKRNHKLVRVIE